jgi:hypothetical protein
MGDCVKIKINIILHIPSSIEELEIPFAIR